jgi:hypothetical protein
MEKSMKYEKFAQECAHLVATTETQRDRKVLMEMAETWNKLAEEAERREGYTGPC